VSQNQELQQTARAILAHDEPGEFAPEITLPNSIAWICERAQMLRSEGKELLEGLRAHDEAAAKIRQRLTEIRGIIQQYEKDIASILAETKESEKNP
jgi:DNA repair ATPase RecN